MAEDCDDVFYFLVFYDFIDLLSLTLWRNFPTITEKEVKENKNSNFSFFFG